MSTRATRRQFLSGAAAATSGMPLGGTPLAMRGSLALMTATAQSTPESTVEVGRVAGIAWSFAVLSFIDNYNPDRLQPPPARQSDVRYAAALVEIENDADQGLNFFPNSIRIRDIDGIEYAGGTIFGEEPRLNGRNLNEGERARGWVWFVLPDDTVPGQLVFAAPSPLFSVALPSDARN